MLRVGTDIERLARGQATTRAELTVQVLNPVINELVALSAEVNVIEDADTRLGVWATKADAIVETYALPEISNKNRRTAYGPPSSLAFAKSRSASSDLPMAWYASPLL